MTKYLDTEVDMKGWAERAMEARLAREEQKKKEGGVPPSS